MRKSFDGLMAIIRDTYQMDPFANAVYLFCGRRHNTLKALYFGKDGFVLLSKRLDNGRFQWTRNESEVRALSRHPVPIDLDEPVQQPDFLLMPYNNLHLPCGLKS